MEDTAIRYIDFQKRAENRTPDWHAITRNLKLAGESVGCDERHALDKFVSFFQPQLRPVTERMPAIELVRFLLNLNWPDSEYDIIIYQMRGLTRKARERIQTVMSHMLALGNKMTVLSYNESTGMTTRLFNVDTRAGLHVGTVGELVH